MKITLVLATSLDGHTTNGKTPGTASWASAEDQAFFDKLKASSDQIVMGSNTYSAARHFLLPTASQPRLVLTARPDGFASEVRPGLVFSSESPTEVANRLTKEGKQYVLVVGGAKIAAAFLAARLVDELFVTIEPVLFGGGLPFSAPLPHPVALRLVKSTQLNQRGTLLLHYSTIK